MFSSAKNCTIKFREVQHLKDGHLPLCTSHLEMAHTGINKESTSYASLASKSCPQVLETAQMGCCSGQNPRWTQVRTCAPTIKKQDLIFQGCTKGDNAQFSLLKPTCVESKVQAGNVPWVLNGLQPQCPNEAKLKFCNKLMRMFLLVAIIHTLHLWALFNYCC